MLQMCIRRVHSVRGTSLAQARQRKMVVQRQRSFGVVKAFHVLIRFCVVFAPVHML